MTPVSSPTPDEQAAEEVGMRVTTPAGAGTVTAIWPQAGAYGVWEVAHDDGSRGLWSTSDLRSYELVARVAVALAHSENADLRASLVVVREQLARAEQRVLDLEARLQLAQTLGDRRAE